ncbi:MAG: hypothetical protein EXR28_05570 [Betaproteobacteria bacterium]|nr:hypothetical protein [Betaproteobacteria bacterium]
MRRPGIYPIALLSCLLTLLGGCVADYKRYSEERFSAAPDLSEPCGYRWVAERVQYRLEDGNGYGWGDAAMRGQTNLLPNLRRLSAKCAVNAPLSAPEARVSAYTLEFVNRDNRKAMIFPAGFFHLTTLGYLPLEMSNYFAVCMQARLPDGSMRVAVARGTLEAVTNVWGAMESPMHAGDTLRQKNRGQLLLDLTQQAWHKLWVQGQKPSQEANCRATLDGLVK